MNDSVTTPKQASLRDSPAGPRKGMRRDVQLSLTLVFFILSALVATQLKTQQKFRNQQFQFAQAAQEEVSRMKQEVEKLKEERDSLQVKVNEYQQASERDEAKVKVLSDDLKKAKTAAGMMPVKGPGVVVMMRDNPQASKETDVMAKDLYLVHDWQVLQVVNELRSAGAEAVAVNGRRLGSNSFVRCVGLVITVDGARIGAPYKVEAVGQPETLQSALEAPGGIVQELSSLIYVKVMPQKEIVLPALEGPLNFKFAASVETPEQEPPKGKDKK